MRLWRRGSSQERPLRPCSSQGSENSYTEEPSVDADAQSAVYADLNSPTASTQVGAAYRPYSPDTYSEIPDPLRPVSLRAYIGEGTYENAGYVLSEAGLEQPESSAGSASTPSSAYYSDVSSCETHSNKKKKKKRKHEERSSAGLRRCLELPNISSSVALMNRHNLLARAAAHPPPHAREILPLALELLPQRLALDEGVLPPLRPSTAAIHAASQVQTLPAARATADIRTAILTCPRATRPPGDIVPLSRIGGSPCGTCPLPGVERQVEFAALLPCVGATVQPGVGPPVLGEAPPSSGVPVTVASHGTRVATAPPESLCQISLAEEGEEEDCPHRSLPPLPSRQQQGPQRRGVYLSQSKQDQPLPPLPSEYV